MILDLSLIICAYLVAYFIAVVKKLMVKNLRYQIACIYDCVQS